MNEMVMSEELAEKEFERWADAQGINLGEEGSEERNAVDNAKRRIVKAFMNGSLIVNDDFSLEYTVSKLSPAGYAGEKIRIGNMTARAWIATDQYKASEAIHKLVAVASSITGKDVGWFSNLSSPDFLIFTNVVSLFMNA